MYSFVSFPLVLPVFTDENFSVSDHGALHFREAEVSQLEAQHADLQTRLQTL